MKVHSKYQVLPATKENIMAMKAEAQQWADVLGLMIENYELFFGQVSFD
jgi:hypothetical protein